MRGQYIFNMAKSRSLCLIFSITISGDSASYFLEMVVTISLEHTLTLTRMGVDRETLPSKGHKGPIYLPYGKTQIFDRFCLQ